jgi:excisionase family DNA binding protein
MTEQLLTTEELADRLVVSPRTVIEWARAGRIPEIRASSRIRRFDYGDVVAALKANVHPMQTRSKFVGGER